MSVKLSGERQSRRSLLRLLTHTQFLTPTPKPDELYGINAVVLATSRRGAA